jgi:hypothetical protein
VNPWEKLKMWMLQEMAQGRVDVSEFESKLICRNHWSEAGHYTIGWYILQGEFEVRKIA